MLHDAIGIICVCIRVTLMSLSLIQIVDNGAGLTEIGELHVHVHCMCKYIHSTTLHAGPRFVLQLIKVFEGSFGGPTLYENPQYVTPNAVSLHKVYSFPKTV